MKRVNNFGGGIAAYDRGDYATAFGEMKPLAGQGDADSQNNLGFLYYHGQGVPQDYAASVSWYRKGADQGVVLAQYALGFMYGNGRGVPQDYVLAHKWLNLAASRATRAFVREGATKDRDTLAAKMNTAQIAEAQRLAREWTPKKK